MNKAIFCFKVWGIAADENGNEDWGYIKASLDGDDGQPVDIISEADYQIIHEKVRDNIAVHSSLDQNEVIMISLEEYEAEVGEINA